MLRRIPNHLACAAALPLMLVAIACCTVTVADRERYASLLLTAGICAAMALACLALPLWRGPTAWRLIALVLALPAWYVATNLLRRGPSVFFE